MRRAMKHGRLMMMVAMMLVVSCALGQSTSTTTTTQPQGSQAKVPGVAGVAVGVTQLQWMAGAWLDERGGRRSEEHWTQPAGGTMIGMNRTVAGERTVFFEYLRIEIRSGEVVYLASPKGRQPATPFKLVEASEQRAVFENPQHDFPQRIIYQRKGDELHARVEGMMDGKEESESWVWTSMK